MSTAEQHLAILAKHLGFEHSRILDIGSGGGELSLALSHEGAKVTGIECSRDQMKSAIARQGKDCNFMFSVGENLPFRDSRFDATVFLNSIHHIPEDSMETAISEAISVTKSGGLIYVAEPLAEGACFELDSPVEDETVVRAQAQQCLTKQSDPIQNFLKMRKNAMKSISIIRILRNTRMKCCVLIKAASLVLKSWKH